ncbi:MAG: hypothetical protein A4E27_00758 [Methanobacterium sp. PtaU1.Bin242]|nr:MAG: hypothetical protein A4E27_00758 [Methanobacterium sp. PtaU1.Bin242]
MDNKTFKRSVHILLVILVFMVIISGLGIFYYQVIEFLTLGLLSKDLAFKIHTVIFFPFLIVLIVHSFMSWILEE